MHMSYVHEEIIVERTNAKDKNEAVWEKETAFLKRFQEYYEAVQQATREYNQSERFPDISLGDCTLETSGGSHDNFADCTKVHWKACFSEPVWDPVTVADAMKQLVPQDDTHCMTLRVIVEDEDPSETPAIVFKAKEDRTLRYSNELLSKAQKVTETEESWSGLITCHLFLPDTDSVPSTIVEAYHSIEADYCDEKCCSHLIEDHVEEYEGNMEGGAFEDFFIEGSQLADFLSRMQQLSDLAKAEGGLWQIEGYQYSRECSVLCFETDEWGKVVAKHLKS